MAINTHVQAFLQMRQPLEPSLALDILHTHSPSYASMYLESALEMGVAAPQDYHSELLLLYLQVGHCVCVCVRVSVCCVSCSPLAEVSLQLPAF